MGGKMKKYNKFEKEKEIEVKKNLKIWIINYYLNRGIYDVCLP